MREVEIAERSETLPHTPSLLQRMDRLVKKLFFLIPLGIIGNIVFTLACTESELLRSVTQFSLGYLLLAMVLSVVPWFTGSFRLYLWSGFLNATVCYQDAFRIAIGAELGAAVTPPLIGGSAVKIGMLMQRGVPGSAAVFLTSLESFEDCIFFLIMVPIALTVSASWNLELVRSSMEKLGQPWLWATVGGFVAILGVIVAATLRSERLAKRIPMLHTCGMSIRSFCRNFVATCCVVLKQGKILFALTMVLTAVQWSCRYSIVTLLLMSLGIGTQPVLFMALQVIVFALLAFVPTPGGAGGAEMLFSLLYSSLLPAGAIGVVTAGWRFLTFYFLLLLAGALFFLLGMKPAALAPQTCPSKAFSQE